MSVAQRPLPAFLVRGGERRVRIGYREGYPARGHRIRQFISELNRLSSAKIKNRPFV